VAQRTFAEAVERVGDIPWERSWWSKQEHLHATLWQAVRAAEEQGRILAELGVKDDRRGLARAVAQYMLAPVPVSGCRTFRNLVL